MRSRGSLPIFIARYAIVSSGLVRTMKIASDEYLRALRVASLTILALMVRRSSRLIPGLRGTPAVITTISEPFVAAKSLLPTTATSLPTTGKASSKSSALPWGIPSTISTRTRSAISRSASQWAVVEPVIPAPTMEIFEVISSPIQN